MHEELHLSELCVCHFDEVEARNKYTELSQWMGMISCLLHKEMYVRPYFPCFTMIHQ